MPRRIKKVFTIDGIRRIGNYKPIFQRHVQKIVIPCNDKEEKCPENNHTQEEIPLSPSEEILHCFLEEKPLPPLLELSLNHSEEKPLPPLLEHSLDRSEKILKVNPKKSKSKLWTDHVKEIKQLQVETLWTEKYRPKLLQHFFGHEKAIADLRDWIESREKLPLLLSGPPGLGKTTVANIILSQYGYSAYAVNASDTRNGSDLRREISSSVYSTSSVLGKANTKKIGMIIDEVDGADDNAFNILCQILCKLNKTKCNPIIFICNNRAASPGMCKLRATIASVGKEIRFYPLNYKAIVKVIDRICKLENIVCTTKEKFQLFEHCQGDARQLLIQLQFLKGLVGKSRGNDVDKFQSNKMVDLFEGSKQILYGHGFKQKKLSRKVAKRLLESDHDKYVMVLHESIPHMLTKTYRNTTKSMKSMEMLSESFSCMDILDCAYFDQFNDVSEEILLSSINVARDIYGMGLQENISFRDMKVTHPENYYKLKRQRKKVLRSDPTSVEVQRQLIVEKQIRPFLNNYLSYSRTEAMTTLGDMFGAAFGTDYVEAQWVDFFETFHEQWTPLEKKNAKIVNKLFSTKIQKV